MTPTLTYKPGGAGHHVDLDRLVASRMLVQANSGGGKSRAIRQLLEETHGRIQHLVIDPEGEFATLRERYDYVLAAKTGGEALASPRTAKLMCRRFVELGVSAIIDLYELEIHERREFVKVFLTELVNLPRSLWRPILVVIDEAHTFCPQQGESQALAPVISLCTLGRKRGFAAVLATQRISKLHKDAAAELLNKMIGRTGLDVDVKRAGDELGFDKDGRQDLPRLEPGEFFVYGPAISPIVTRVRTGAVTTTHPEPGQVSAAPTPAPTKIRAMLAQLSDLPKEADEEARSIDDYKRQNAQLRAQLTKAQKSGTVVEKPVTVVDEKAIFRALDRQAAEISKANAQTAKIGKPAILAIERAAIALTEAVPGLHAMLDRLETPVPVAPTTNGNGHSGEKSANPFTVPQSVRASVNRIATGEQKQRAVATLPQSDLPRGQQKILNALAELEAIGVDTTDRAQLGMFAGYNLTGGTGGQHIADLNGRGLLELPDKGAVRLTNAGRAAAEAVDVPDSLDDLHRRMLAKLPDGQQKILRHLIGIYPETISRVELGQEVAYNLTGGTGGQHVADLVTMGAATLPSSGKVRASDLLFPEGLSS